MYVEDFAYGLAELGQRDAALGHAWHVPTPPPLTAKQFVDLNFAAVDQPPRVRQLGAASVRALGLVWPVAREGAEMLYQFSQPHTVDARRYRSIAQEQVTPYVEGIRRTLEWYRRHPQVSLAPRGR